MCLFLHGDSFTMTDLLCLCVCVQMLATHRQLLHLEFPRTCCCHHNGESTLPDVIFQFIFSFFNYRHHLSIIHESTVLDIFHFCSQLNLVVLVMTLHKMHSTAALKPDSSRHDNLRLVKWLMLRLLWVIMSRAHCVSVTWAPFAHPVI